MGTREIALFHHTDCGMLTFTTPQLHLQLKSQFPAASAQIQEIDFLPFPDLEASVREDVAFFKENPLVLKETTITGWIYEVETGKVRFLTLSI